MCQNNRLYDQTRRNHRTSSTINDHTLFLFSYSSHPQTWLWQKSHHFFSSASSVSTPKLPSRSSAAALQSCAAVDLVFVVPPTFTVVPVANQVLAEQVENPLTRLWLKNSLTELLTKPVMAVPEKDSTLVNLFLKPQMLRLTSLTLLRASRSLPCLLILLTRPNVRKNYSFQ